MNVKTTLIIILYILIILAVGAHQLCAAQSLPNTDAKENIAEELNKRRESKIREKEQYEKKTQSLVQQEQGILRELHSLEEELKLKQQEFLQYEAELQANSQKMAEMSAELENLEINERIYKARVARRIRAIYKFAYSGRRASNLKILLRAEGIADLLNRYKYMGTIVEADEKLLLGIRLQKQRIEQQHAALEKQKQQLQVNKNAVERKRIEILLKKQERENLLNKSRTQKELYNQAIEELKEAVVELEELLNKLGYTVISLNGLSESDLGNLPWPISENQATIIKNLTRAEKGITIRAEMGTEIRSVADGAIAWIGSMMGYGNIVLVSHGKGYISVYAHVSEVLVKNGQYVKKQQVIASVGDTGSLIGPILYFELWKDQTRLETRKWMAMRNKSPRTRW